MFLVFTLYINIFRAAIHIVHLLHHDLLLVQDLPLPLFPQCGLDCHDAGGCHHPKDGGTEEHLRYFHHPC